MTFSSDVTLPNGANLIPRGSATESTEIGYGANASGEYAVAIGQDAACSSNYGCAFGSASNASGTADAAAIGNSSVASGNKSAALGCRANVTHDYSIGLGYDATTTAANQLMIGYGTNINAVRFGDGTGTVVFANALQIGSGNWIPTSDGDTGGTGSAGAGNQYVELTINGTTYKVLHDGTV
jgi:hypothetical protein